MLKDVLLKTNLSQNFFGFLNTYHKIHESKSTENSEIKLSKIQNLKFKIQTQSGQSAMSIASRLGYVSIVEVLRPITSKDLTERGVEDKEKYKVVFPEVIHDAGMSDSEDEIGWKTY